MKQRTFRDAPAQGDPAWQKRLLGVVAHRAVPSPIHKMIICINNRVEEVMSIGDESSRTAFGARIENEMQDAVRATKMVDHSIALPATASIYRDSPYFGRRVQEKIIGGVCWVWFRVGRVDYPW